ncbi:unnamed protein product [Brassica oleracea]|nr:unnamed protein product [Brassica napus]
MYRILLIFLATTLVCSVAEANTQQTVNEICKQTIDIKFCNGILAKATSPSMKDLLNVTVTEAQRISDDTYFFISTILLNAGNQRPVVQKCVDAYAVLNSSFTNALSLFNSGRYAEIITLMVNISSEDVICETDFNVPGYNINPMIEKNRETKVFVAMEKIIGHMKYGKSSLHNEPEAKKTSPLRRTKQSSVSVKSSSQATSHEKVKPSGVANSGKPWSSIVDSSVDLPYKPSSTVTSSKKTFDPVTFLENMSKSLACAVWSEPQPSNLTKTPEVKEDARLLR